MSCRVTTSWTSSMTLDDDEWEDFDDDDEDDEDENRSLGRRGR